MFRSRIRWTALAAVAAMVCAASAGVYNWDGGGGSNHSWTNCSNWDKQFLVRCYPYLDGSHLHEDAVIPAPSSGTWSITLSSLAVDHFEIDGNTTLSGSAATLSANVFTIVGASGGTTATVNSGAIVSVQ